MARKARWRRREVLKMRMPWPMDLYFRDTKQSRTEMDLSINLSEFFAHISHAGRIWVTGFDYWPK